MKWPCLRPKTVLYDELPFSWKICKTIHDDGCVKLINYAIESYINNIVNENNMNFKLKFWKKNVYKYKCYADTVFRLLRRTRAVVIRVDRYPPSPDSRVVADPRPMPTPSSTASAVNHVPGLPHQSTVLTQFLLNGDACTGSSCDNNVRSCKTIQIHFMIYVQRHWDSVSQNWHTHT